MGIFGGGMMKEGPGIDKNARKKKGFFLYIDIVIRKFIKLMAADLVYFLVSLPFLVLAYIILSTFVMNAFGFTEENIQQAAQSIASTGLSEEDAVSMMYLGIRMLITMMLFNFFGSGPVSASYAYISRCYIRGEHAWLWSDGWQQFKGNLKQSVPLLLIDLVVIVLGMNAVTFYTALSGTYTGAVAMVLQWAKYVIVILLLVYGMLHIYVYQIMITYECKFTELVKYSLLITIAKLPMSVLLTAITGGIIALLFGMVNPLVGLIAYAFFGLTFTRFPLEFYASRVIEKNIKAVKKQQKKNKAKVTYINE